MKTVLLALTTLMLFSGCFHKGPRSIEHVRAYGYPIPVYQKEHVINNNKYKEKHKKQHKTHPNPGYAKHQKSKVKKNKSVAKKVHPQYKKSEKHADNRTERKQKQNLGNAKHQKSTVKKNKNAAKKVHPQYQESEKHSDNKKERKQKRAQG